MPYRTPSPAVSQQESIGIDFWNTPNSYLEMRAISVTDAAIVGSLKKLVSDWYNVTQTKYPAEAHPILIDLGQAALGKGTYLRVQGESRDLIRILVEVARMLGWMTVDSGLFRASKADSKQMQEYEREAAIRWVSEEPQIRKRLQMSFAQGGARLDKELLARFETIPPEEIMKVVYFRGVVQGNTAMFDSFALAQDLYRALYE